VLYRAVAALLTTKQHAFDRMFGQVQKQATEYRIVNGPASGSEKRRHG
jgi:hypothetical protein